jgi:hypothetical protein
MKNQHKIIILILSILIGFFLNIALLSPYNSEIFNENEEYIIPDFAAPLKYSDMRINDTYAYRLFENINFTIYTSDFSEVDHVTMQIDFSNGSVRYYDMNLVGPDEYYFNYKPEYNAPLGFQNVSFLIYNDTHTILNDHINYANFTITTNYLLTFIGVTNPEYYIGDTLTANLLVVNFDTYNFQWNITAVDSVNESAQKNLLNLENNAFQFTITIDNETFSSVDKTYYIKLNISDINSGKIVAAYFPFKVRNSKPIITSSIELSTFDLFRTEECTISLNATDIETASEDLTATMYIYDSEGHSVSVDTISFDSANLFSDTFTIPANRPIGTYRVNVSVVDEHGALGSKVTFFNVKNNAPEIHSYKINGLSMNQTISIFYGRDLVFTFNVSDIERLSYVKVALLNEDDEWFNISREYIGENTEITIRTLDLKDGIWYVYIYVIDSDGAITSLIDDYDKAPKAIRIIPDVLSNYLLWIILFVGMAIGVLVGMGIIYSYLKFKLVESVPSKKKEISPKKTIKEKVKIKESKEEPKKKEIEDLDLKKEEKKEEIPKRKIKRKL